MSRLQIKVLRSLKLPPMIERHYCPGKRLGEYRNRVRSEDHMPVARPFWEGNGKATKSDDIDSAETIQALGVSD
ncbi:MAG: hypothetical protein Kow0077_22540 [Anaerolineae bacterium]